MKSRASKSEPTTKAGEDWAEETWVVDCSCGVNFDDGEEMVNCDECGVWVHTRCSKFVKADKSFTCHNCKLNKRKPLPQQLVEETKDETEVAQLLAELPNKTIRNNRNFNFGNTNFFNNYISSSSNVLNRQQKEREQQQQHCYPLRNPRQEVRGKLWTERPMEERVHVQGGVEGGGGVGGVFGAEIWRATGYVPKRFSFKYSEFPCWEEKERESGAGVLYSLSNEGRKEKVEKERVVGKEKREREGSGKDKMRRIVLQCGGKRGRDEVGGGRDRSSKKKSKVGGDGKREKFSSSRPGML